jgi:hypothetical protein
LLQLPSEITTFVLKENSQNVSSALLAHLRRELFQACLLEMLDDEFMHAYIHGIALTCGDGIKRHIYPCVVTYSADYPEK